MNELEKSVSRFYMKEREAEKIQRIQAEKRAAAYQELYESKCKELERAELIIELLFDKYTKK